MAKTAVKKLVKGRNKKIKNTKKIKSTTTKKTRTKKKNKIPSIVFGIVLFLLICASFWFFIL